MLSTVVVSNRLVNCYVRRTFFNHIHCPQTAAEYWSRIKKREDEEYVANDINDNIIVSTERWVNDFVIKQNLCPYASKYRRSIRVINLNNGTEDSEFMSHVIDHMRHLTAKDQQEISTKLLVFPQKRFVNADAFLKFLGFVQSGQHFFGVPGVELVPFHPTIRRGMSPTEQFDEDNPLNFTARSPYPTLHLFKTVDAEKEVRIWENRHNTTAFVAPSGKKVLVHIFQRNHQTLLSVGAQALKKKFRMLYDQNTASTSSAEIHFKETENASPSQTKPPAPTAVTAPAIPTTPPVTFASPPKRNGGQKKVKKT